MDYIVLAKKRIRYISINAALFGLLVLLFLLSVSLGSVSISFREVISILYNQLISVLLNQPGETTVYQSIVIDIRLPRTIAAMLGGAALSLAGLLLQIFFRNPIVDPFVLGVSSGAALMVGIVTLLGITMGLPAQSPSLIVVAALAGAMTVMMIIVGIASRVKNIITLLVIGLMVGYLCSAVIGVLVAFAEKESIRNFVIWTMGSFSGFTWNNVALLSLISIPVLVTALLISKPLNALLLGEGYAKSMGVKIKRFKLSIVFLSSLLTGIVTAFAGPVAFVGLAVPHLARLSFGTSDNRILIPGAILLGALITGLCDLMARLILSPVELPISAVTSFIGAPIVIYLLVKRRDTL